MIDHEYDAIVVGAGGAGLRVSKQSLSFVLHVINLLFRLHLDCQRLDSRLPASQSSSQPGLTLWPPR